MKKWYVSYNCGCRYLHLNTFLGGNSDNCDFKTQSMFNNLYKLYGRTNLSENWSRNAPGDTRLNDAKLKNKERSSTPGWRNQNDDIFSNIKCRVYNY